MAKAGKLPTDRMAARFWFHVFRYATRHRDPDLCAQGIEDLGHRFAERPGYGETLERYREQLAALRSAIMAGR